MYCLWSSSLLHRHIATVSSSSHCCSVMSHCRHCCVITVIAITSLPSRCCHRVIVIALSLLLLSCCHIVVIVVIALLLLLLLSHCCCRVHLALLVHMGMLDGECGWAI